jgi:osmotically-inducible protein OsmY
MKWIVAFLLFYVAFIPSIYLGSGSVLAAATKETSTGPQKTTPTASDQSENEADRKITQQIRQAVTKDDSLSTSAQNVTIVTQDGTVVLRGMVKTQGEKQKIAQGEAGLGCESCR